MSISENRGFEITAIVSFPTVQASELDDFASKLGASVAQVVSEHPAVVAYMVTAHHESGQILYGLRFKGIDPVYIEDMTDEILQESVERLARSEGETPIEAEREESVLVLA